MKLVGFLLLYILIAAANVRHPQGEMNAPTTPDFDSVELSPTVRIGLLPEEIDESSGLMIWDSLLWTLNDSGGLPEIFGLDPVTGAIRKTIHVTNAENRDWETLTQDDKNIYIGDVGNNWGRRQDLGIWIVPKSAISDATEIFTEAARMDFHYPQQISFIPALYHSHFDCEAMVAGSGNLYLFTKDWVNRKTYLYRLPATAGTYDAALIDSFDVRGLVTGAAWDPQRNLLALSGYENFYPLVWLFYDFTGVNFFKGRAIEVNYPDFHGAQTEGIGFYGVDSLLISSERTKLDAAVYQFSLRKILGE